MTTIHIVTSNGWGGYRINGAFSSNIKAEKFILNQQVPTYGGFEIEEYELDECIELMNSGLACWYITAMYADGECSTVTLIDGNESALDGQHYVPISLVNNEFLAGCVQARSHQHAIEIVDQLRQEMLESGEWK